MKMNAAEKPENLVNVIFLTHEKINATDLHIGTNLITGLPLVGDFVEHKASGQKFKVVERTWQADENREANIFIRLALHETASH